MNTEDLHLCHECGLLHSLALLAPGDRALCARCGAGITSHGKLNLHTTTAFAVTALVLYVIANCFPLITLQLVGITQASLLITGAIQLWLSDLWPLAILVFLTSILLPGIYLVGLLYVLVPIHYGKRAPQAGRVFRWLLMLEAWNMLDIYMLGILVAMTKLGSIADVVIGPALYAFACLILVNAANGAMLDQSAVWRSLDDPHE